MGRQEGQFQRSQWSEVEIQPQPGGTPGAPTDEPPRSERGSRVLFIGDDNPEAETFRWALRALDLGSYWARRAPEGLAIARRERFDLILVGLAETSGLEVARALRQADESVRLILLCDPAAISLVTAATSVPALGVLEKPVGTSEMIAVVNTELRHDRINGAGARGMQDGFAGKQNGHAANGNGFATRHRMPQHPPGSVAERWASFVLRAIDSTIDPKTVTSWARFVGVSRSVLCECCRLVQVSAHDARDFTRVMRAICRSGEQWRPEAALDLGDARTLNKLLARAGLPRRQQQAPTVPEFLMGQHWIPEGNPGLVALQTLLFNM
jgi:DNA-binding response OmpR family regulator